MKSSKLYAQVLVDASGSNLEATLSELKGFGELFSQNATIGKVFDSPTLSDEEKQKVLAQFACKLNLNKLAVRFLSILTKRRRVGLLSEIFKEIEAIKIEKSGGVMGEIVCAVSLDAVALSGVTQAFSKKLNRPVILKERVDSSIIAGMRVTISGVTYDGSIKNKIEKLAVGLRKE